MVSQELYLTPLLLLPGVALLIISTSARFTAIDTEFHRLLTQPGHHAQVIAHQLHQRARLFKDALFSLYASVALFSLGSLLGGILNAFLPVGLWVVGLLTLAGITFVVLASVQLTRESMLCLNVIEDFCQTLEDSTAAPKDLPL